MQTSFFFAPDSLNPAVVAAIHDAGDGCSDTLIEDNSIALVQRGNCDFGQKAINAQRAGAVGIVLVDTKDSPTPIELHAPGTEYDELSKLHLLQPNGSPFQLRIPMVSITRASGLMLNQSLNGKGFLSIEYELSPFAKDRLERQLAAKKKAKAAAHNQIDEVDSPSIGLYLSDKAAMNEGQSLLSHPDRAREQFDELLIGSTSVQVLRPENFKSFLSSHSSDIVLALFLDIRFYLVEGFDQFFALDKWALTAAINFLHAADHFVSAFNPDKDVEITPCALFLGDPSANQQEELAFADEHGIINHHREAVPGVGRLINREDNADGDGDGDGGGSKEHAVPPSQQPQASSGSGFVYIRAYHQGVQVEELFNSTRVAGHTCRSGVDGYDGTQHGPPNGKGIEGSSGVAMAADAEMEVTARCIMKFGVSTWFKLLHDVDQQSAMELRNEAPEDLISDMEEQRQEQQDVLNTEIQAAERNLLKLHDTASELVQQRETTKKALLRIEEELELTTKQVTEQETMIAELKEKRGNPV